MKYKILASSISSILLSAAFAQPPMYFPQVSGKDLNDKPWSAPTDFPGEKTIVLIAFKREQQAAVDTWTEGLGLNAPANTLPWLEMPLINNPGMFMRWFINTGMKRGIASEVSRSHVWTAYTDKPAFLKACEIPSEEVVYALVVDRKGRILAIESGNYSQASAKRLTQALDPQKSDQK